MTLVAGTTFSLGVVVKLLLQLLQDSAHNTHTRNLVIVPVQLLLFVCMRFEVLAAVLTTQVFWDITPCRLVYLLGFRMNMLPQFPGWICSGGCWSDGGKTWQFMRNMYSFLPPWFQHQLEPVQSPWRWKQYVPPKRCNKHNNTLFGVKIQTTSIIFTWIAMKVWGSS